MRAAVRQDVPGWPSLGGSRVTRRSLWLLIIGALGVPGCEDPLRAPASAGTVISASAGGTHSCAVTEGGAAWCWGRGVEGQLGTGEAPERAEAPVRVRTSAAFTQVTAGFRHACGLATDGTAYCWGWNHHGQLGVGSTFNHSTPYPVEGGLRFVGLSAGWFHTCGLTAEGSIWCWGRNGQGQLGTGSRTDSRVPLEAVGERAWVAVTAGGDHTCALDAEARPFCWGLNNVGQLGTGGTASTNEPKPVNGNHRFTVLSVGYTHTCAIDGARRGWCWGSARHGEIGATTIVGPGQVGAAEPVPVFGGHSYRDIGAGFEVTCATTTAEALQCWGRGGDGQLSDPLLTDWATPQFVRAPDDAPFTDVMVSSAGHVCARSRAGALYCWGRGSEGQLGVPGRGFSLSPARVVILGDLEAE